MTLRTLGLFEGIAGIDLGLRAVLDVELIAYSEYEPPDKTGRQPTGDYAARLMAHRFPDTPNLGDITLVNWQQVAAQHGPIDLIHGGFPCQDISLAGKGAGIDGDRSGLWRHFADAIRILRPRIVVVENVAALTARGIDRVLADVAACGLDASWDCIPAAAVGAPHRRDRIWIIAYPTGKLASPVQWHQPHGITVRLADERMTWPTPDAGAFNVGADPDNFLERQQREKAKGRNSNGMGTPLGMAVTLDARGMWPTPKSSPSGPDYARVDRASSGGDDLATVVARAEREQFPTPVVNDSKNATAPPSQATANGRHSDPLPHAAGASQTAPLNPGFVEWLMGFPRDWTDITFDIAPEITLDPWTPGEWPDTPRVLADVPQRVARLKCLGNAVVPQVAAHIGEVIKRNGLAEQ